MKKGLVFLKTDQDFANFKRSRLFTSQTFRLRVFAAPNQNTPRFGFIVSKKTVKRAAGRNLIKRRFKAMLIKQHHLLKPMDYLFFPKAEFGRIKFSELGRELTQTFQRNRLYGNNQRNQ